MIQITVDISNEGAAAALSEINSFLRYEDQKMAGDIPDRKGHAALGYVVLRKIRILLEEEFHQRDLREKLERQKNAPTIRDVRRGEP